MVYTVTMSESQKFQDNETVIVTRGTKSVAKGTEATVLGYDGPTDSYAVRIEFADATTRYTNVKASSLGPKPERTFTQSEIEQGLSDLGLDGPAIVHDLLNK